MHERTKTVRRKGSRKLPPLPIAYHYISQTQRKTYFTLLIHNWLWHLVYRKRLHFSLVIFIKSSWDCIVLLLTHLTSFLIGAMPVFADDLVKERFHMDWIVRLLDRITSFGSCYSPGSYSALCYAIAYSRLFLTIFIYFLSITSLLCNRALKF